jgi:hypothetical protein
MYHRMQGRLSAAEHFRRVTNFILMNEASRPRLTVLLWSLLGDEPCSFSPTPIQTLSASHFTFSQAEDSRGVLTLMEKGRNC